jgi:hypothetical protein
MFICGLPIESKTPLPGEDVEDEKRVGDSSFPEPAVNPIHPRYKTPIMRIMIIGSTMASLCCEAKFATIGSAHEKTPCYTSWLMEVQAQDMGLGRDILSGRLKL